MATRLLTNHFNCNLLPSLKFFYMSRQGYTISNFFHQHLSLKNNQHKFNVTINKYLSTETTDKSATFQTNYEKCYSYLQDKGIINPKYFQNLIENLKTTEPLAISMAQTLFLLESCTNYLPTLTNSERINLFIKIWSYLQNNNLLNSEHYVKALKLFELNKISVDEIGKYINESDMTMDLEIYEKLILLSCSTGDIDRATEMLSKMKNENIPITERVFNYLILGHSRNKNLSGCTSVLQLMNAANFKPSTETKTQLLKAYIENKALGNFETLLEECQINNEIFSVEEIIDIIESAATNDHFNIINKLVKVLPYDMIQSRDIPTPFRNLCIKLIYQDKINAAFNILISFPGPKLSENQDIDRFGVFFINELIQYKVESSKIIDICLKLNEKNPRALHIACEIILKNNPNEAITFFKALSGEELLKSHYFWPIFINDFKINGEIGILNTLKVMKSLNVDCDKETFTQYCLPYLPNLLKNEVKALEAFVSCGLKISQIQLPLIIYLIKNNQFNKIMNFIKIYPTATNLNLDQLIKPMAHLSSQLKSKPDINYYAKLIDSLSKITDNPSFDFCGKCLVEILQNSSIKTNISLFMNILNELSALDIKISETSSKMIFKYFLKNYEKKNDITINEILMKMTNKNLNYSPPELTASNIKLPRDMNLSELECHLVELESKNMNTRGVLRKLLQLSVRENKLELALDVLSKCKKLNVHQSGGMLASIFDLHIKLKDLENAKITYKQIQQSYPGFNLDDFKIIDYLTLMVAKDQLEEAKLFLSKHSRKVKQDSVKYLYKNLWNLLSETAIYGSKLGFNENEAKNLFNLLNNMGYCDYENILLGPIIREYILKNNLKDAVKEYMDIGNKYRKTPLQFELMSLLVHVTNGNDTELYKLSAEESKILLEDLVKLSFSIHGDNANSAFLLAIAKCGTENQIRKLLINPKFKFNQSSVIRNCEHLSTTGKTEIILKLAKASRGLQNLNEELLYNTILDTFRKENNYLGALELFAILDLENDLKISREFLKNLVNLLNINNIEIPTAISIKLRN